MLYLFEDCALDTDRRELRRANDLVPIEPQVFDLLAFLIENRERVVGRDELFASVWQGRIVSDSALSTRINAARSALRDNGEDQRLIKTYRRKGLRFIGEVCEDKVPPGSPSARRSETVDTAAEQSSKQPVALPDRPSIAVLPFTNLAGDPQQEYLADGVVEDIITELSRFRELFVIARNSSFQYKHRAVDVRQVGRDLGVRYVLEGSVRRSGDRIRVAVQLIDAENGGHVWAEKYDNELVDIFTLQDAVTQSVVGAIQPQILVGEGRRAARKSPANLDAFDCCLRGIWHFYQGTPHDSRQAESWLRRSVELDPTLAPAHALLARVLVVRCWAGYSDDIDRDFQAGEGAVHRALALDNRDAACHYALAILTLMKRCHGRALVAAQQAINLNPNFTLGHFALGETRIFAGQFAEALGPLVGCLRLSPCDPSASGFVSLIALAHYHLSNYDEAAKQCERALQGRRTYVLLRTMAATLGQLGRTEEARSVFAEMERCKPINAERFWKLTCPYADPAHEAHLLDGLQKARRLTN